jgi:predicted nuclease with TOPRIM domain
MSNLLYENHMLKNTNYYLLCTISQFEKTQLAKMNKLIQEYNQYISTNMYNNKEVDEINHKLQITIANRETLEQQLIEVQEKHDILKERISEMETEYNILSNQLQDTEEKHVFIQKQLEETLFYIFNF